MSPDAVLKAAGKARLFSHQQLLHRFASSIVVLNIHGPFPIRVLPYRLLVRDPVMFSLSVLPEIMVSYGGIG